MLRWSGLLAAIILQAIVLVVVLVNKLPPAIANRDVAQIGSLHPLAGFLSNAGGLMWSASTAICALTAVVLKRQGGEARQARFYFLAAALSAYLMLDDVFMLHEDLIPRYLPVAEEVVTLLIVAFAIAFLLSSMREIRESRYDMLLLALCLLAASVFSISLPIRSTRFS